jgi:GTPase Era involved in 16S rRNA processing
MASLFTGRASMIRAKFAVVGHPNKGKSSIVSTLSNNDSIQVSQRSGTTTKSIAFRVETNSSGYELFDTPGFQRPTKVLAWLKKKATQADQRAQAVADFVADPDCQQRFPDEVELLKPLINGAAILYVVDGSRPYGSEYETEMEILQWTGQPSMALINPIENESHVDSWKSALNQYFKTVRVFNPMQAEFEKQIDLLRTFAHLNPLWSQHLELVTQDLIINRHKQLENSAIILSRLIEDLCFYQQSQKVLTKSQAQTIQSVLASQYQQWMKAREQKAFEELFTNYAHFQTKLAIEALNLPPDLFDCEQWYMWGLNKRQLATVAAITAASAGAAVDLAVAGHSFMLGAIGGGLLGFGSAWFGANKLTESKIKGLPLGGYEAIYGPMSNKNFPYVVIGRFVYLHHQISQRSHAVRSDMNVEANDLHLKILNLESSSQKELHIACNKLTKGKLVPDLKNLLLPLFMKN